MALRCPFRFWSNEEAKFAKWRANRAKTSKNSHIRRNRLPTRELLVRSNITDSTSCPFCPMLELQDHLLLCCDRARWDWKLLALFPACMYFGHSMPPLPSDSSLDRYINPLEHMGEQEQSSLQERCLLTSSWAFAPANLLFHLKILHQQICYFLAITSFVFEHQIGHITHPFRSCSQGHRHGGL